MLHSLVIHIADSRGCSLGLLGSKAVPRLQQGLGGRLPWKDYNNITRTWLGFLWQRRNATAISAALA